MARPKESPERKLLRRVLAKKTEPKPMADALGMSLEELAHWLAQKRIRRMVRGISSLIDFDAQVNLKRSTVRRLARIVRKKGEPNETTRRACCDVLVKTQLLSSAAPGEEDADAPPPNDQEAQELRDEMRRSAAPELAAASLINPPLPPH